MLRQLPWIALLLAACAAGPGGKDDVDTDGDLAPLVVIDSPDDGDVIATPDSVRLRGHGTDPEDGELGDASLSWRSDQDGTLGTGGTLTVELSEGGHEITLTATDSAGHQTRATIEIEVSGENRAPRPEITAPLDGAVVREGDPLVLEGAATDREDGTLSGSSLVWASSIDGFLGNGATLSKPSPTLGDHVVTLTAVDSAGLDASTSILVTVAGVGQNVAPRVTIDAPLNGAQVAQDTVVTFEGHATDPEDGPITGVDLVWMEGSTRLGSGEQIDLTLAAGPHALTLTATDSDGASTTAAVTVVAFDPSGNTPPSAHITAPVSGYTTNGGALVTFNGSATDPEDGALNGGALVWTSDLDGMLGSGASLGVSTLSVGRHHVTLTATDSGGAVGVDARDVYVLAPNAPPVIQITSPASGSRSTQGTPIGFAGSGADPEDGALSGASLSWTSSLDGTFGTGVSLTFPSLTAGTHSITLTGVDSGGRVGTDTISVIVDQAAVNLPPVALLDVDPAWLVGIAFGADAVGSYDPDGTITTYRFDFGDGTSATVGASATATHTYAAPGRYTITLTVTDDDGATAQATSVADVEIPLRVPTVVQDVSLTLGSFCALDLDGQDSPHVVYKNLGHDQIWYARHTGSTWATELIEGPGFGVGGLAGEHGDVAVDSAGVIHAAYLIGGVVHYARRAVNGTWTVEIPNGSQVQYYSRVAIALDPANAWRPTIAYTSDTDDYPALSFRTGAGVWTTRTWTAPGTYEYAFRGGLAFSPSGTATLSVRVDGVGAVTWSSAAGFGAFQGAGGSYIGAHDRSPVALDLSGAPLILHRSGLADRTTGSWRHSYVANTALFVLALDWDTANDEPVMAFQNEQSKLEIQRPDGRGLWHFEYQGPMDGTEFDVRVDSTGETRACFFRSGNLVVW